MPIVMRLRASAAERFSHMGLGMTPNIAPPSSLNVPSESGKTSKLPMSMIVCHGGTNQLDQYAARARGMNERNRTSMGAGPRMAINQAHAGLGEPIESGLQIGHAKGQMVETCASRS